MLCGTRSVDKGGSEKMFTAVKKAGLFGQAAQG
jgi:hypothetical protein